MLMKINDFTSILFAENQILLCVYL